MFSQPGSIYSCPRTRRDKYERDKIEYWVEEETKGSYTISQKESWNDRREMDVTEDLEHDGQASADDDSDDDDDQDDAGSSGSSGSSDSGSSAKGKKRKRASKSKKEKKETTAKKKEAKEEQEREEKQEAPLTLVIPILKGWIPHQRQRSTRRGSPFRGSCSELKLCGYSNP